MEQNSISSDLIRGHIDTIILYSLIDGDKFAQQISDCIEQKSNNEYKINQATLYSSLKRLETLRNVSSYMNDAGELGRRKFFRLTTQGKKVVEQNLNSWTYSKNIIDKLMDSKSESEPVTQTKTVYVYVNENKNDNQSLEKQAEIPQLNPVESVKIDNPIVETPKNNTPQQTQIEQKNDVNFRSLLNSLIVKSQKTTVQKPESVLVDDNKDVENKQQSLSETILDNDFNKDSLSVGKIDFSDLKIQASKEGYKISVSSKDSAVSSNFLLINKLNFFTSFILLMLCVAEFLPIYLLNNQTLGLKTIYYVGFIAFVLVYPIIALVKLFAYENKKRESLSSDSILTCAIIVFNLLLLNVAILFLSNMDFSAKNNLILFLYTPAILMLNSIIFIGTRYCLSKTKLFYKS